MCVAIAVHCIYVVLNFTPKVVILSSIRAIKTGIDNTIVIILSVRYVLDDRVCLCINSCVQLHTHLRYFYLSHTSLLSCIIS